MRDAAFACIRRVGVETGGSNVQFALDPDDGEMVVIEMNPRVSRSSALASKATGFPIAKIAARLAVGYTLDEIPNDITRQDAGQLRADHRLRRHQGARAGPSRSSPAPPACSAPRCSRWARPWPSAARSPSRCRRRCARSSRAGSGLNCDPGEAGLDDLDDDELLRRGGHRHARPALPARGRAAPGHHASTQVARGHQGRPVVPRPDARRSSRSGPTSPRSASTA